MDKQKFHPQEVIDNLEALYEAVEDSNLCFEELSLEDTFKETKEMVSRFAAKKPIGQNVLMMKCPLCGRRLRSGMGSSSRVRDNYCQDCGQLIDWSDFPKY